MWQVFARILPAGLNGAGVAGGLSCGGQTMSAANQFYILAA